MISMLRLLPTWAWVLIGAATLTLSFVGGFKLAWHVRGAAIETLKGVHAQELASINAESARRLQELSNERDEKVKLITRIDLENLKRAQAHAIEISELRAAVAAGTRRLSVRAKCPAATGVPEASGVASLDVPGKAELDPSARQDYLDLRAGILDTEAELAACKQIAISLGAKS